MGISPGQMRAGAGAGAGDHFEVAQHREEHDVRERECALVCLLWSVSDSRNGDLEHGCSKGDTNVMVSLERAIQLASKTWEHSLGTGKKQL